VTDPSRTTSQFSPKQRPLEGKLITVTVPIYDAFDDVSKCLESLIQHHDHAHQVLLIDDCSPDARIAPLLESFAERHAFIRILRNDKNLGFTKTVNRACRAALGDVVILNSDTQVTAGWLEKLDACANSSDKVGTVTPLSNAAGAFSIPKNNVINKIPRSLTVDDMGQMVEQHSKRIRPSVPTGNGFCMFISRNLLNVIGYFDEVQFPRGYGEENDFCMRAKAKGFINLIDDATFIYHHLSASFGASRQELIAKSRETLRRLHPSYKEEVTQWLKNDPLDGFRTELESLLQSPLKPASRVQPDKPCLLYVIHDGKGGTPLTNADLIRGIAENHRCLLLTTGLDHWNLLEPKDGSFQSLRRYRFKEQWRLTDPMNGERLQVLEEISREYQVDLVHVRHLLGSGPEVVDHFHRSKIPVIFSFHDYYTVCPTIQLIDREGTYCQGKCTSGEQDCRVVPSWFRGELPRLKHEYVHLHRKKMKAAIEKCDFLVTTCHSAKDVIEQAFPEARRKQIQVIEHGRDIDRESLAIPPTINEPAKIVCLGNIDHAKGSKAISALLAINQRKGKPFEFHFLGQHASGFRPGEAGGIYHGRYKREELPALLREIRPSFSLIASIWAETYCHTLTESWALGLPVFASHFGALKERVDLHGGGWLIDPNDPEECFQKMLKITNSPVSYAEACEDIKHMPPRSTAAMVDDYREIYSQCLKKK
jgi:GT2 family glycosyltransferase/glycosyltransferase involved in cell wall biosynthesis